MRIHGLVMLVAVGLTEPVLAQNAAAPDSFLPPSPRSSEQAKDEPMPLPQSTTAAPPASPVDIEAELRQFRNELREFQATREEVARSSKSVDADADRVTLQQRQELVELLTKLATKGARSQKTRNSEPFSENSSPASRSLPPSPPADPPAVPMLSDSVNSDPSNEMADPFALGKVLFKAGDFVGAERAFRKSIVEAENEMTLKYLLATCVRRQSRWKESISLYRSVAESNQDPVLRDLAKWQLDNIRWMQESESQLEKMRRQREKQSKATNGQHTDANLTK